MKTYSQISIDLRKKQRKEKIKNKNLSPTLSLFIRTPCPHPFDFRFYLFFLIIIIIIIIIILDTWFILLHSSRFYLETIYFFSIHFILNELSPSHFPTFKIFVKISSLKSLTAYDPENRKILRLPQNSTKFFWVTRFRETNLTAQSVLSSKI